MADLTDHAKSVVEALASDQLEVETHFLEQSGHASLLMVPVAHAMSRAYERRHRALRAFRSHASCWPATSSPG